MVIRVACAGLGAVGLPVAEALAAGRISGMVLTAVSARTPASAKAKLETIGAAGIPYIPAPNLHEYADVVVEGLPPASFLEMAAPTLTAGKTLIALSATQLLAHPELQVLAETHGGKIIIPTGALCGLDAIKAIAESSDPDATVVMQTRKPPASLVNAPFVIEQKLDLLALKEAKRLYAGSVSDAAALFPANVNVAVALALAGIGPDRTQYEIWADPNVARNTHTFTASSRESSFEVTVQGTPSDTNPATGALTPLSAIAALRGLVSTLRVGT